MRLTCSNNVGRLKFVWAYLLGMLIKQLVKDLTSVGISFDLGSFAFSEYFHAKVFKK